MAQEKIEENKIKSWLKDRGFYHFKNHGNIWTEPGRPDIVACIEGRFYGIEVKAPGGRPSDAQLLQGKKIEKSGGVFMIVYGYSDFLKKIKENGYVQYTKNKK